MANLVFDFLHSYETGERRESEPANAYQYDEGHVLEAVLPSAVTSCEIHYWIRGQEKSEAYTPGSITQNDDGSCTVTGNIPNLYFETNGELRVYIVVTDGSASITTYEGYVHICQRSMPDDYVDDDPENEATRVLTEAQEAAATATAAAETCEEVRESIPEDYSQLSEDVDTLKDGFDDLDDRVTALEQGSGSGLTEDIKQALLQIAEKVAYIDEDGQDYYDALEDALYPPADLVSISAVYTQSGTVYDTDSLDSLKSDLVVTAHMSDSTTRTVTDYVLSGTLTEGTSTVTVTYGGKTTTFTVTVTEAPPYTFYDYLQGDGTAFIDTGLSAKTYASDSYKKYIKFKPNALADEKCLFAVRNAWGTTGLMVQLNKSGQYALSIAFGNAWNYDTTITQGTLYEVTLDYPTITVNGTTLATVSNSTPTITSDTMTIPLFAHVGGQSASGTNVPMNGGYANQFCTHKIYQFKVTDSNNVVVADIVPAVRNSDGVVGMYDTVRDIFMTNFNSSGAFTIGNDE